MMILFELNPKMGPMQLIQTAKMKQRQQHPKVSIFLLFKLLFFFFLWKHIQFWFIEFIPEGRNKRKNKRKRRHGSPEQNTTTTTTTTPPRKKAKKLRGGSTSDSGAASSGSSLQGVASSADSSSLDPTTPYCYCRQEAFREMVFCDDPEVSSIYILLKMSSLVYF